MISTRHLADSWRRPSPAVLALTILLAPALAGAEEITIDLGRQDAVFKRPVPPEVVLQIRLVSRTAAAYEVRVEKSVAAIDPLPAPRPSEAAGPCSTLLDAADALRTLADEAAVAAAVEKLEQGLAANACPQSVVDKVRQAIRETTRDVPGQYVLARGEELSITVSRLKEGKPQKTWVTVLSTGARGAWRVTYGFAFSPDRDELFFSRAVPSGGFIVAPEADRKEGAFIPAVFFSWLPSERLNRTLSWSLSGGLGFDSTSPAVFLGPSLTYNQNLSLIGGVVMRESRRLDGKYQPDDPLQEALSTEQLHAKTFRPAWFLALGLRFGSNPFGDSKKD